MNPGYLYAGSIEDQTLEEALNQSEDCLIGFVLRCEFPQDRLRDILVSDLHRGYITCYLVKSLCSFLIDHYNHSVDSHILYYLQLLEQRTR